MNPRDWLQEQLFERRIVLATGRLDDDVATKAAAALLALDADGDRPIELHLDSPDGALGAAFVLIDTADKLRSALRCRGQIGGPAIGVVAAGDHRAATPHARFHLSQPTARFVGTRRKSPRRAANNRSCFGSSTGAWPGAPAGRPRRSPMTCGAGAISTHGKRSTTASSTRSRPPGSRQGSVTPLRPTAPWCAKETGSGTGVATKDASACLTTHRIKGKSACRRRSIGAFDA